DGKAVASGKAGRGEEFPGFLRITRVAGRGDVAGARARRDEAAGGSFTGTGDALDEIVFVNDEGEGAPDAHVVKWFALHIETQEIRSKKGSGVEVGALLELAEERGRHEVAVDDEIGQAGRIEIVGGDGARRGEDVDAAHPDGGGVPVARVSDEA